MRLQRLGTCTRTLRAKNLSTNGEKIGQIKVKVTAPAADRSGHRRHPP
ncbi:hypothetical protein [Geobacter anodireducens]